MTHKQTKGQFKNTVLGKWDTTKPFAGLVAEIQLGTGIADVNSKTQRALQKTKEKSDLTQTTKLDPGQYNHPLMLKAIDRMLTEGRSMVMYTIDHSLELGQLELAAAMNPSGKVFAGLEGTPGEGVVYYAAADGWFIGSGGITVLMFDSPQKKLFYPGIGLQLDAAKIDALCKRIRRDMSRYEICFTGTVIRTENAEMYVNAGRRGTRGKDRKHLGSKRMTVHCDRIIHNGAPLSVSHEMTVLLPNLEGELGELIAKNTDGGGVFDPFALNEICGPLGIALFRPFEGIRINAMITGAGGELKNQSAGAPKGMLQDTFVFMDPKKELILNDGTFRITIMSRLHRPERKHLNSQEAICMRMAEQGLIGKWGVDVVDEMAAKLGDIAQMASLLNVHMHDYDQVMLEDLRDEDAEEVRNFTLRDMVSEFLHGFDHEGRHYSYKDLDRVEGTEIEGSDNPLLQRRMAKRFLRLATEQMNTFDRCRITLDPLVAVCGYMMFDISIMDHPNPRKRGAGFYFNRGVLAYGEVLVNHKRDIGNGSETAMPVVSECVITRTPFTHEAHMTQHCRAVYHEFYAGIDGEEYSCFVFFSCALDRDYGLSFAVVCCIRMAGADFDDLVTVWLFIDLVEYVRKHIPVYQLDDPRFAVEKLNKKTANTTVKAAGRYASGMLKQVSAFHRDKTYQERFYDAIHYQPSTLGVTVNACMVYGLEKQNGLVLPDACKRLSDVEDINLLSFRSELVIDADKMGKNDGLDADAIKSIVNDFWLHVPAVGKTLGAAKMPHYVAQRREQAGKPPVQIVEREFDTQIEAIIANLEGFKTDYRSVYENPEGYLRFGYMERYTFTNPSAAKALAREYFATYNRCMREGREAAEKMYARPEFANISQAEKDKLITQAGMKAAGPGVWMELTSDRINLDPVILEEAFIAYYQLVYSRPLGKNDDGTYRDVPDTLLYENTHNAVYIAALRRAKVQDISKFEGTFTAPEPEHDSVPAGEAFEGEAEETETAEQAVSPIPASRYKFTVVNGYSQMPREQVAAIKEFAKTHPVVQLYRLDGNNKVHMNKLWAMCPELNGKRQTVVVVYHKDPVTNEVFSAFVLEREIKHFELQAGYTGDGKAFACEAVLEAGPETSPNTLYCTLIKGGQKQAVCHDCQSLICRCEELTAPVI